MLVLGLGMLGSSVYHISFPVSFCFVSATTTLVDCTSTAADERQAQADAAYAQPENNMVHNWPAFTDRAI